MKPLLPMALVLALAGGAALAAKPHEHGAARLDVSVEGHADLDGEFVFDCADAAKAAHVEVGLFAAFPRLQRLDVQVATAKAQFKRTLRRTAPRLALTR